MNASYINPFIKSIRNVFKTMLATEVTVGKPHIKADDTDRPDVSGVIGFSGDASGSVVLCFSSEAAVKVASTFAGMDAGLDSEDFADAIGELANMVAGGAKSEFVGLDITVSLPSVIIGERHKVSRSVAHPRLVIPCETGLDHFVVEVSMKIEQQALAGAAS